MAYVKMYNWYKNGFLPFSGSVSKQPAKIMQIFDIFEDSEIKVREKQEENIKNMRRGF